MAGAVHILIKFLFTPCIVSRDGHVQSSIRDVGRRETHWQSGVEGRGHEENSTKLFRVNVLSLRGGSRSETSFSNHSCCKNTVWLKECTGQLSHHHFNHLPFGSHQLCKQGSPNICHSMTLKSPHQLNPVQNHLLVCQV